MQPKTENPVRTEQSELHTQFFEYITSEHFPCIMAQTVFKTERVMLKSYQAFGSSETAAYLLEDLRKYLENYDFETNDFFTFIAAFPEEGDFTEEEFESLLWHQLQLLHQADEAPWDPTVSPDPASKEFSFSLLGRAFYMVGLHPNSSRIARRSPVPAMVFNLHFQFEKLREMGTYQTIRDKIREKDVEIQGSVNPMLSDFGEISEARQYSGRAVDQNWKCPFHHK